MKRNVFLTLIMAAIFFASSMAVSAVDAPATTESGLRKLSPSPTKQAERQEKKEDLLANKKTKAYAEIDRRIEALNKLIEKVNTIKRISTEQKALLVSQIQIEITSLTGLRTKVEGDTDLTTLNTDKKAIIASYRVFAFFIPKVSVMAHANSIIELADLLTSKTTDSGALAKIVSAKGTASAALSSISALTVEGYPGNNDILKSGRESLRTALKELKEANNSIVRTSTGSAEEKS